jgi:hypothetical protein
VAFNGISAQQLFRNTALPVVHEVEEASFNINGTGRRGSAQTRCEGLTGVDPPCVRSIIVRCDWDICWLEREACRERFESRNLAIEDAIAFRVEERSELTNECHVPELRQVQLLESRQARSIQSVERLDALLEMVAVNRCAESFDAMVPNAGPVMPPVQDAGKSVLDALSIATVEKIVEETIEIPRLGETDLALSEKIIGHRRVVVSLDRLE